MRVLHVVRTLDPANGGVTEAMRQRSSFLCKLGASLEILCLDDVASPWLRDWPVVVHAVGPALGNYGFTLRLNAWLDRHAGEYSVLVISGIWQYHSAAVRRAARRAAIPYFLFVHGSLDPWFRAYYPRKHVKKTIYWKLIENRVMRDAEVVLFTSEEEMRLAHNEFRPYHCRPVVIGNGIAEPPSMDASKLAVNAKLSQIYPALRNRPFFHLLARIHEKKGIDLLFHAYAANRSLLSNYAIVVSGTGGRESVSGLRKLALDLGIADDVVWTGPVYGEDKWNVIKAADVYILPSHQENFGISVVEPMACGVPVLISDKVNIWREIHAAKAGFVENDDIAGTSQLLLRWAELPPEEKLKMGANARNCYLNHFGITTTNTNYFRLLMAAHHNRTKGRSREESNGVGALSGGEEGLQENLVRSVAQLDKNTFRESAT